MAASSAPVTRSAFSLLELLVVIVIISIVYFLGFSGMEREKPQPKALTALNLKSSIEKGADFTGKGTLICTDGCRHCYFRNGIDAPFEAYENRIDLSGTKAYTLDAQDALLLQDEGRYQDHKICLEMHFYPNGSATQLILENRDGIFFLPAFFGEPQKADSLEEARDLWLKNSRLAAGSGDFY